MASDTTKTCLNCKFYVTCRDPKKSFTYYCNKFKQVSVSDDIFHSFDEEVEAPSFEERPSKGVRKDYQAMELNLIEALNDSLDGNKKVPQDFRIDDRDIKEFPNFYDFVTSKKGLDSVPFAKQLAIGLHLFGEYCPRCSHKNFNNIKRIPIKWSADRLMEYVEPLNYGVCSNCGVDRQELILSGELNLYSEFVGCLGQRSGKSITAGMLAAYHDHKLLKLQKPVEVYGLLKNSEVMSTFVGLTFEKCVENLWVPYHNMIRTSPWFQEYHSLLNFYSEKYGEELYKFKDTFIRYSHRNYFIHASGPSKKTLRGATRLRFVLDELGWFDNDEGSDRKERQSANEVYTALDRSLKTLKTAAKQVITEEGYYEVPNAYAVSISSPSDHRDKIMSLVKVHKNSNDVLTLHLPTWKFNPNMPKSEFSKEYRDNPVTAERDFGANPPLNDSPFIGNGEVIEELCGPTPNRVEYTYIHKLRKGGEQMRAAKLLKTIPFQGAMPKTVMALDAGYSNNSFAITVGHLHQTMKGILPTIDVMIEVAPTYRKNVLNYNQLYERILKPLVEVFNVGLVVSDRWQNKKIVHDLEARFSTLEYEEYMLRYDDLITVRNHLQDERKLVRLPRMEMTAKQVERMDMANYPDCFYQKPVSHFWYQCITVKDKGNQVIKGLNLTDDIFRSTSLCLAFLLDEDYQRMLLAQSGQGRKRSMGVVHGKSLPPTNSNERNRLFRVQNRLNTTSKGLGRVGGKQDPSSQQGGGNSTPGGTSLPSGILNPSDIPGMPFKNR